MKKLIYIVIVLFVLTSCGGKKDDGGNTPALPPVATTLVFPAQNSLCVSGTVISVSQSSLTFKWNTAENANGYDISIKNLLTNAVITQSVTLAQATITLARNVPYSWFVTSKSAQNSATAKSDTWKFYNSGAGVIAYVPFPADNLIPSFGQYITATNNKITLSWAGSDIDNDIATYDVYMSTSASPSLYKKDVTGNTTDATVTGGAKYYWKVVTKDIAGNTSESDIVQFTVN